MSRPPTSTASLRSLGVTEHWNDTQRRLRDWPYSSAQAEKLAAQVLHADGFANIDPSLITVVRTGNITVRNP